ncbi:TetR/AcrR family transcriptional regulator [Rhodococcus sp. NPDC058521]|uniref:TetR/AcrR family transcriptional regulator n=1 Tax=Rhodococcus sp. NPDC058521 TaxID=3346536 RepID=UPI00364C43B5
MTTDTAPAGLRKSKKRETRQSISDHATRLFIAKGFEQTTIAEIAAAARIAKKTVTNYFAHKEDLALDHQDEFTGALAATVDARQTGESALHALRRAFQDAVTTHDPVSGFSGADFARMVADSPTLTACLRELHDTREIQLARALADATDAAPDDIVVRASAGVLGTVHRVLFQRIQELTIAGRPDNEIADLVGAEATQAFDLLEPALGTFAVA